MAVDADIRTWFGGSTGASLREYVRSRGHLIFLVSAGVIFIHLLTQAFVDPEPMSDADDNILTGLAGPALVLCLTLAYPHLSRGYRAVAALGLGLFAVVTAISVHLPHMVVVEVSVSDVTAVASLVAGVLLTVMGVWLIARSLPNVWWRLGLIPAGLVFVVVFLLPVMLAVGVTNTARVPISGDTPTDRGVTYREVTFETSDGVTIAGWYIPSENGAAVIAVHGAGKNRTKTLEHAAMLARNGYGALMIDLRGYGESEGSINSMGWTGYKDIPAAVEFLEAQDDVDEGRVGGLGLSMGGEVLLQAAGEDSGSGLAAVVSEGAGARTYKEVLEVPGAEKYIALSSLFVREAAIKLLTGVGVPPTNDKTIAQFAPNPVLLISGDVGEEREWNQIMRDRNEGTVELFEANGGHIDGLSTQPEEYEARVIAFFDEALRGE
jgi:fermentation-respiration switch protein FrsA (DUF1100 family)